MENTPKDLVSLHGIIGQFIYTKAATGFGICRFRVRDAEGRDNFETTLVGVGLTHFKKGDSVEIRGEWEESKHGRQVKVLNVFRTKPKTKQDWETYLLDNIDGVGPTRAKAIVAHFGADHIERVLDENPERILEVSGMKKKSADKFIASWREDQPNRSLGLFIAELGFSQKTARKICDHFGMRTEEIVRRDPYRLMEVDGIGFKRADDVALNSLGIPEDSPLRAKAVVEHVMEQAASNQGHVYLPKGNLLDGTREAGVPDAYVAEALKHLLDSQKNPHYKLIEEKIPQKTDDMPLVPVFYLRRLHQAEIGVAKNLSRLLDTSRTQQKTSQEIDAAIQMAEEVLGLQVNTAQRQAVRHALVHNVSILTGKAGTGKSTSLHVLTEACLTLGIRCVLTAPTGRAQKRMTEITGQPASTIHRLLEWNPEEKRFDRNRLNPIEADLIIVDEFSMVDIEIAYSLFSAIRTGAAVMIVGDPNQLMSVGPGRVLADMLDCDRLPRTDLTEIFRQAQQSLIVTNAHRVLAGTPPQFFAETAQDGKLTYDCYFTPARPRGDGEKGVDAAALREQLTNLTNGRIPQRMQLNPIRDIQVMVPQKKGDNGMYEINRHLQEVLNPRPEWERIVIGSREFRIGDRVMQIKNNYQLEIYNGDVGFVTEFNREEKTLNVDFGGRLVQFDFKDTDNLQLSYAVTVHKMQGSEAKVIVLVLLKEHYMMLQRNLIYTAFTRARQLLVIVGEKEAINIGVSNKRAERRNSMLVRRIRTNIARPAGTELLEATPIVGAA